MQTTKFFAAAILAAGFATGAFAGPTTSTVTQTGVVADQKTDYSDMLFTVTGGANSTTFAGFKSSLGTLTGVQVTYSVNGTETGTLTNNSASTQTFNFSSNSNLYATGGVNAPLALTNYLAPGLTLNEAVTRYTLGAGASTSILPQPNGFGAGFLTESTTFTDPAVLAEFIGTNFKLDLNTLSGSTFAGGGGNITTALNTSEGGNISIIYDYTPSVSAVPEPSALAALGAGLLGLTFVRFRKRA